MLAFQMIQNLLDFQYYFEINNPEKLALSKKNYNLIELSSKLNLRDEICMLKFCIKVKYQNYKIIILRSLRKIIGDQMRLLKMRSIEI